jgi:UDPglucose 6-dehydrogenase
LNISVIGTNYLGAAHAAGMAEFGHRVIGVDIDAGRVEVLNSGRSTSSSATSSRCSRGI